jgi:hypothetical protein
MHEVVQEADFHMRDKDLVDPLLLCFSTSYHWCSQAESWWLEDSAGVKLTMYGAVQ